MSHTHGIAILHKVTIVVIVVAVAGIVAPGVVIPEALVRQVAHQGQMVAVVVTLGVLAHLVVQDDLLVAIY